MDTWFSKVNSLFYPILKAEGEEKEKLGRDIVAAVEKEIEPLLKGAGPFFGGSKVMTLAEALTGSFLIRYKAYSGTSLLPASIWKGLSALPNFSKWSEAVLAEDSVTYIFDGPSMAKGMAEKIEKMKAEGK